MILSLPSTCTTIESAMEAARRAADCLAARQRQGHWPSDYSGPLFLLPGLIIAYHVTKTAWPLAQIESMLVHLRNTQNRDGGWGLHVEGESTVLGTTLNYVALRCSESLQLTPTPPGRGSGCTTMAGRRAFPPGASSISASWASTAGKESTRFAPNCGCCRAGCRFIRGICGAILPRSFCR